MKYKKYVLFNPGPLHHFFFIPLSLLWKILKKNEVILVIDKSYKESPYFLKIKELPGIKKIVFIDEKNSVKNYLKLKKTITKVLSEYSFSEVYTHNPTYVASYVITFLAKELQPDAKRIYFQVAREVPSYSDEAKTKLDVLVRNFRYKSLPYAVKKNIILLSVSFKFFIVYKFLPFLFYGVTFAPWQNPHYPKSSYFNNFIKKGFCLNGNDETIFFDEKLLIYTKNFFKGASFNLSKSTLDDNYLEIYSYFFDERPKSLPIISIFPSWGVFSKNLDKDWLKIIHKLKSSYKNHKIQIKFHPGVKDNFIEGVFTKVSKEVPDIEIIHKDTPAFKMVIDSSIIIGDTTSVLWFGTLYKNKKVFSLDVFNFFNGDCLKIYSDKLIYIDSFNKIDQFSNSLE
ncbi:hypothetical protein N9R37_00515 [Gammaproteobacteria bacterium]|nr:hypothetical protein [Gammaproteobacteria bacterium]